MLHLPKVFLFAVFLSLLVLPGCSNKAQPNFERPPSPVQVSVAVSQDVPTYLDAIGKTVAREVVSIQPQVSGRITKIHFTDGANVRKGDMLFTIDTRHLLFTGDDSGLCNRFAAFRPQHPLGIDATFFERFHQEPAIQIVSDLSHDVAAV